MATALSATLVAVIGLVVVTLAAADPIRERVNSDEETGFFHDLVSPFLRRERLRRQLDPNDPFRYKTDRTKNSITWHERENFIKKHNEYRSSVVPQAANMEFMDWDEELEVLAQEWADACVWSHGQPDRDSYPYSFIGQNIQAWEWTYDEERSMDSWYIEKNDYTYETNSCAPGKQCGHYTAVVWATTNKIGCGIAYCPKIKNSIDDGYYIVCNMGPGGNAQGQWPYISGTPCSQCPVGKTDCENNLCRYSNRCLGKTCSNGGTLMGDTCLCMCPLAYTGETCETETNVEFRATFDDNVCFTPGDNLCFTDTNQNFPWVRQNETTPSGYTGPYTDRTRGREEGHYVFIETTGDTPPSGERAGYLTPVFNVKDGSTLEFYYHMYGDTISTLNVYTQEGNSKQIIWTKSGDQNWHWYRAQVNNLPGGSYQFLFEAVKGSSFTGDIAIDDVSLIKPATIQPSTPAPITEIEFECSFDTDLCEMTQSQIDEFDWTRQSGGTQSGGTGPQTDHSGTGSYIYAEASPPVEAGDIAEIQTPLLTRTGISRRKLEFYYHMRGSDMGTINVYTETETARVLRWTRTGDNGDRWSLASVDLPTGTYSLVFEYIRGLDWRGDLALDDMKVILYTDVTAPTAAATTDAPTTAAPTTAAPTTAAPTTVAATTAAPTTAAQTATTELPSLGDILWQCTFEAGLCESTMDSSMDFEWTRLQGKTQSGLTGPSSDHTIGDTTGFYLYIEASPPRNEGDKARLVTPSITSSSEMVLTFYSHMYGATMGTLNVYRRTGSNDNLIMSLNGDRGDIWNLETAVLDPGSFSLVFEAMRGSDWSSDLAIDDITVSASPKGRADIAFVVDGSGSVGAGNFEKMKSFVRDVTNDLTIGSDAVQVAFVLFSDSSAVEFGLNAFTDKESLASAINQVIYKGGATNIASGLRSLRQDIFVASMGDRATAPNVGILLSDGPSNWDAESTVPEAQEARATGIELFAVGVGPDADKDEMLQITNSEERVMAVSSFDTLSTMKNSIIGSTRNDENECVSSPCRNGGVCLDRLDTFVCECSSGFSGDTCEQNCVSQADVIFAIDTSGSIAVRDFRKILTFVGKVSKQLQVGQNARIGLVTFSSTAKVEFHLNEHMDIRSVLSSLDKVKYRYGATNTQAALEMMQNDMFTTDNGDREAPNVVILVTDGISTVEQENTLPNAESLKLTGAHIFVIGVGSFVDVDELSGIASSPSESNMILVTDFDALDTVVMTVAEPICTGQNSCSSSPCQNGGQCFNKVNGYTCSCPSDKGGLSCEVDCPRNIDLAFLIDESGSIGLDNFRKVMDFVMAIAKNVATGSRIGVVTFSDNAAEEFNMVKHGDKQQILDGIEAIKYSGGATHTAAGLQMLRESTFQTNNGNRNGVPDVAIVITDGISTVNEVNTGTQASLLKSIGVEVWSIGIGQIDNERQNELSEVATSDSTIKTVSDFESLQGLVNEIVSTLCSS